MRSAVGRANCREEPISSSNIGTLLYLSKTRGWNLKFTDMTVRFSGRHDVDVDLDQQIEHLRGRSPGTAMPNVADVKAAIDAARTSHRAVLTLTRGCDVCEVLSKGVHDVFGRSHHNLSRGGPAMQEVIRAAYSRENFQQTRLYAAIKAWEAKRAPLTVL